MWNCTHFRHPTDEQLGHVDIFFSNYYNLQSVYFEFEYICHKDQLGYLIIERTDTNNHCSVCGK